MTVQEILRQEIKTLKEQKIESPILKARIILSSILNITKEELILQENRILEDNIIREYKGKIEQLVKKQPLQYITNHQEFMKLDLYVNENVLIPRADTEILVEEVIQICNLQYPDKCEILDLCTGSGAIGIAISKYTKNTHISLLDISEEALKISKQNAKRNNIRNIEFINQNMFQNLRKDFDIIVSNPPYIKSNEIKNLQKEVINEPKLALDGGEDGLKFYKIIQKEAYKFIKKNGYLCLEIGYNQKEEVINLLQETRMYNKIYSKKDLGGNDRIIIAKRN
ncbi:MAG: peptide chain release factor N(5)-glutamine methyltransferase [Clostridia bacterium]|nr:peptide chain release factor N(5)-glutamine methyltransferase [Clostridia bacterium]